MSDWSSVKTIAGTVQSGKTTARQMVEEALKRLEAKKEYKTVISDTRERALKRADEIDKRVNHGENIGRLAGVPFIAKDNFLAFGAPTTAASNILKNFEAPYQATAIEKLEAEGAICIAKANLDAFAHGASTENSDFFTTLNPHDKTRVPGGSSGGSAASVALDIVPFALGTDTGGSIRQPASFCGVVGYKPTYGLVSRNGVIAMASSTDVIGPITKNVEDTALVLDVMSGRDRYDSTTIEKDSAGYTIEKVGKKAKIGVIKEFMSGGVAKGVKEAINKQVDALKKAGHDVEEVSLPATKSSLAVYYIVVPAEISSNLSRYDGQRFGYSDEEAKTLNEVYLNSRSKGFGDEAKRRIMTGTFVLSSGYHDAYYKKAQQVRTKIIDEFEDIFKKYDFLIGPTAPTTAFKIGENANNPLQMYLADEMTVSASLAGLPAINVPVGEVDGLPVGLQIIAPQRHDRALLSFASSVEELVK